MKKLVIFVLFNFFYGFNYGQSWRINYLPGYGYYDLQDLKDLQEYFRGPDELRMKAIKKIPEFVNHTFSIEKCLANKRILGVEFASMTTGGLNNRYDYSGEQTVEMHLKAKKIGCYYKNIELDFNRFSFFMKLSGGIVLNKLNIKETIDLNVLQEPIEGTFEFAGTNFYLEPLIGSIFKLNPRINIEMCIAYDLNAANNLKIKEQTQYPSSFLQKIPNKPIKANWTGFRLRFGISFEYGKK